MTCRMPVLVCISNQLRPSVFQIDRIHDCGIFRKQQHELARFGAIQVIGQRFVLVEPARVLVAVGVGRIDGDCRYSR